MRTFIRQTVTVFLIGVLASCGGIRMRGVDKSVFNAADADLAEKGEHAVQQSAEPVQKAPEPVRVGVLLPLSGDAAKLGTALRNAALMALFDVNNPRLILQFYDTQGTPAKAREASELAISQGADLIIGPVFSSSVKAVRPSTHDARIGVITFSSHPSNLGDGVYTISSLTSQQAEHITRYACDKGYKRFAILSQDNATGDIISLAIKTAADACGAKITKAAFYDPKLDNLQVAVSSIMPRMMEDLEKERDDEVERLEKSREAVAAGQPVKMKDKETDEWKDVQMTSEELETAIETLKTTELVRDPFEFDAIFVTDEGSRLRSLGALFSYYDLPSEIRVLGTSQWAEARPAREASLVGGWFTNLPSAGFAAFARRYQDAYDEKPPRIASQAYDAVALAAVLAETGGFSYADLTTPSGFNGIDGLFRLLPNGLSERGLQVLGVEKKGFVTLSPAIEAFETEPVYAPEVFIKDFRNSPDLVYIPPEEPETAEDASAAVEEKIETPAEPVFGYLGQKPVSDVY